MPPRIAWILESPVSLTSKLENRILITTLKVGEGKRGSLLQPDIPR
jgi:hypothetical protein